MKITKLVAIATFMLAAISGYGQNDVTAVPYGAIEVLGEAKITVPADYVEIQISANAQSGDAREAHRMATEEMAKAIAFLKKQQNVSDVKTTRVSLNPRQIGPKSGNIEYYATQSLSFRLNDVQSYDNIMLGLIESGINGIGNVSFRSSEAESFADALLKKAMQDARRKAVLMAAEYGQQVGRAIHISDRAMGEMPRPMLQYKAASYDMAGPSVEAGEIELTTTVNVQFELK